MIATGEDRMDFLGKKSWHLHKLSNLEKVWKAEKQEKAEEEKVAILKAELHEDKGKHRNRGVEWMYITPEKKKDIVTLAKEHDKKERGVSVPQRKKHPAHKKDQWRISHDDPLAKMISPRRVAPAKDKIRVDMRKKGQPQRSKRLGKSNIVGGR